MNPPLAAADAETNFAQNHELHGVAFTSDYIYEVGPDRSNIRVPVSEIVACSPEYGSIAANPALQLIAAAVMVGVGLYLGFALTRAGLRPDGPRKLPLYVLLGALFTGGLGLWLLCDLFRKRPHLRITTRNGQYRLRFLQHLSEEELNELRGLPQIASSLLR